MRLIVCVIYAMYVVCVMYIKNLNSLHTHPSSVVSFPDVIYVMCARYFTIETGPRKRRHGRERWGLRGCVSGEGRGGGFAAATGTGKGIEQIQIRPKYGNVSLSQ